MTPETPKPGLRERCHCQCITVPTATGNPTPTYAPVGALPAGITFDTATRVIAGTPYRGRLRDDYDSSHE